MKKIILLLTLATQTLSGHAESILGLKLNDTPSTIKARMPYVTLIQNQGFDELNEMRHFNLLDSALDGLLILGFENLTPKIERAIRVATEKSKLADEAGRKKINQDIATLKAHLRRGSDHLLELKTISWSSPQSRPANLLIEKFGPPDVASNLDDLQPYFGWKRGVTAILSDDKLNIKMIMYFLNEND